MNKTQIIDDLSQEAAARIRQALIDLSARLAICDIDARLRTCAILTVIMAEATGICHAAVSRETAIEAFKTGWDEFERLKDAKAAQKRRSQSDD